MIHLFLATGFEEIEALATLDIFRRCGLEVQTVSVTGSRLITGAHGIPVMADCLFRKKEIADSDALVLPGGMPGTKHLLSCDNLCRSIVAHCEKGGVIGAICAAPVILGKLGLLANRHATCYPGNENELSGAICENSLVVSDGNIITGKGPGAAVDFAFAIAECFVPAAKIERVRYEMMLL